MTANAKPSWMPTTEQILDAWVASIGGKKLEECDEAGVILTGKAEPFVALISRAALDRAIELLHNCVHDTHIWKEPGEIVWSRVKQTLASLRAERGALP